MTHPEAKSLQGKNCLVTGSSRGIGFYTALNLAQQGAHVIIVSHHHGRCKQAVEKITNLAGQDAARFYVADLSSQSQIRQFASEIRQDYLQLDVLINNVGGWFRKYQQSEDGIELTFALNHLGYFLLTGLLLERLQKSPAARIINVTSDAHRRITGMRFEDLEFKKGYRSYQAYAQSKLANLLFTYALANRLSGSNITVNAVHPGLVRSEFFRDFDIITPLLNLVALVFGKNSEEGAETPIYLASSPEIEGITSRYFVDKREKKSSPASYNHAEAQRLWQISEAMTDFQYPI